MWQGALFLDSTPVMVEAQLRRVVEGKASHDGIRRPIRLRLFQRRQVFDLFSGFQNIDLSEFSKRLFSLSETETTEFVTTMGKVLDRDWFDRAVRDLNEKVAAELERQQDKRLRKTQEHERLYGRPEDVRDLPALADRFGTRIPLGYLAHATKDARPEPGPVTDALLLSWGTAKGCMPAAPVSWRGVSLASGELPFLAWVMDLYIARIEGTMY